MKKANIEIAREWKRKAVSTLDLAERAKYYRYAAAEYRACDWPLLADKYDNIAAGLEAVLRARQWVKA